MAFAPDDRIGPLDDATLARFLAEAGAVSVPGVDRRVQIPGLHLDALGGEGLVEVRVRFRGRGEEDVTRQIERVGLVARESPGGPNLGDPVALEAHVGLGAVVQSCVVQQHVGGGRRGPASAASPLTVRPPPRTAP